ncbi:xin actin-binding repeat-containing protein 2 isoform X2 [Babesia caballi]|uniref:Xin actin-binding repeat-containing protein 2 isoform X2 n=1 Tax=Babesia caballi TaxID=5871 RepID=A0AAV4LWU8_BABCB|nr:xin actin-binding repeat-containing protein 2 isoform X2 [Babesia caballi]
MSASNAAHQRRNRVLAESTKRLNSLSKPEYDDEDVPESASSFLKEVILSSSESMPVSLDRDVESRAPESRVRALDLQSTRRIALLNLLSYAVSFIAGCYICHALHGDVVDRYCPFFFRGLFALLDAFGAGRILHMTIAAWYGSPLKVQQMTVKVATYGSVLVNLYPFWAAMRKQSAGAAPARRLDLNTNEGGEGSGPGFLADFDEEHLVKIASFVIRSSVACLVFGLLGYDVLYNAPLLLSFARSAATFSADD